MSKATDLWCPVHRIRHPASKPCALCHVQGFLVGPHDRVQIRRDVGREPSEPRSLMDAYMRGWLDAEVTFARVVCVVHLFSWLAGCVSVAWLSYDLEAVRGENGTIRKLHNVLAGELAKLRGPKWEEHCRACGQPKRSGAE